MIKLTDGAILETARLRLEPFEHDHLDALFELNSDPQVMNFLGPVQTRGETATTIERAMSRWRSLGYGWWALRETARDAIIGAACLQNLAHNDDAPLEIGWRLMPQSHGRGYATEAGRAVMHFAQHRVGVSYLVAVANPKNTASTRVMEHLGMRYKGLEEHYDEDCAVYEITL